MCKIGWVYSLFLEFSFLWGYLTCLILVFEITHGVIFYIEFLQSFYIGCRCVEVNRSQTWIFVNKFSLFFGYEAVLGNEAILKVNN